MRSSIRSAAVAVVILSLLATACGGGGNTPVAKKQFTIGFVVPLISNPYWKLLQDFAQGAAGTLGITLLTAQANSDESQQIGIIEGWVARKVDGMVVGAVSDKVGQTVLTDAEKAKIPVVFMQRSPGLTPDKYSGKQYVGLVSTDDIGGGTTEANILYNAGGRKWVAMTGSQGNSVAEDRLAAAVKFVQAHPDVQLLRKQYGNEARDAGQKTVENFLSALPGPGFDTIYSFNDEGALGAAQALANANALSKVKIGAIDGTTDAVQAVKDGKLLVTVGGGYACGAFALTELYDYLNGHSPKNRLVLIPLLAVTPQNVSAYQSQVLSGMSTYDFKAVSATYTPGATTDDYKITLK